MKKILVLLFLSFLLFSCQEEIDLQLDSAKPGIVIEAGLTLAPYRSGLVISRTGDFYSYDHIDLVPDAEAYLYDTYGNVDTMRMISDGVFVPTGAFPLYVGERYDLKVVKGDSVFTASSYLPSTVPIDSVVYRFDSIGGGPGGPGNGHSTMLVFNCYFKDDADYHDYYQIVLYINGKLYINPFAGYMVFDDEMFNGIQFPFEIRVFDAQPGDTLGIELQHITKETFDYFRTLNNIISRRMGGGGTPYNPVSNIQGGALGVFSAYGLDGRTLILSK